MQHGITEDKARTVATNLTEHIQKTNAGGYVYIGIQRDEARKKRNQRILQLFTGNNGKELALKFDLSTRQIYQIIREDRKLKQSKTSSIK